MGVEVIRSFRENRTSESNLKKILGINGNNPSSSDHSKMMETD